MAAYSPQGLCPACMLQAGLDTPPTSSSPSTVDSKSGDPEPAQEMPTSIGGYQILQEIGRGGMGVVYLAEQKEPVRRRVALKIIKLGMDTQQVIRRFEAERQALAMMDHSNIAKVLDAGATDTGRPYFVMELVRGPKITDYCDQHALSTEERLNLFLQVGRAVHHAHQKGVIHRDLKPSNILVSVQDGVPVPKVIDFGLAKATGLSLTTKTVYTAFEQVIGTPAYMSPEQAQSGGVEIDARSDIYSLGVLLYELLTGRTPFDTEDLLRAGLDAMRRKIREDEPPRPSTRLTSLTNDELTKVAKCRKAETANLVSLVRGDLDWIVMKALEKERARRYDNASGLVEDIQRYLSDEAIVARPPSHLYRFGKLLRRNRLSIVATSAVVCLFVVLALKVWPPIKASFKAHRIKADLAGLVLQPTPWVDGEQLQFDVTLAGSNTGSIHCEFKAGQTNGQTVWRLMEDFDRGIPIRYRLEADANTFTPVHSRVEFGKDVFDVSYQSDHADVKMPSKAEPVKVALDGRVFDYLGLDQVMRRLPLGPGYKISLPVLKCDTAAIDQFEIEVTGLETITVPAGTYPCFKLKSNYGRTFWYSTDPHRYLIKTKEGEEITTLVSPLAK
jgi:serine/threonine protein kinase